MQTLLQPPPPISTTATKKKRISFSKIEDKKGCRIGLYGSAGVGKTTLAATMHGKKVFIDLDNSLSILKSKFPPEVLESTFILKVSDWQELIENLNEDGWNEINTIVIDTLTKSEELAVNHVIKTIPYKGNFVKNIEEYEYGKGYSYLYEAFLPLLQALDKHCNEGRNVVLIMHDCTTTVPNPAGENFLRYEPRLSSPASGKNSIRLRVREWLDHLLFLYKQQDVKDKKLFTSWNRIIEPRDGSFCMAKSRLLTTETEVKNNNNILDILTK